MVFEHEEHSIQSIVAAEHQSMVQRCDDLFVVFVSMTMSMVSAQGAHNVQCFDGQGMGSTQMLAILDKEFAVDLNHLVPVMMSFIELDKHNMGPGQSLIMNVAGVATRAINANIYFLGLMETIRAIVANGKAYCNVDGFGTEIFRQSNRASPGYDRLPDK